MNKIIKIIFSVLAGANVFITVSTPIFLILVWLALFGIPNHWSSYTLIILALMASLFRAIKIGWIKK